MPTRARSDRALRSLKSRPRTALAWMRGWRSSRPAGRRQAMLCDRVLGNVGNAAPAAAIRLPLTWQQCRARAVKKTLSDGRTVRVLFPPGVVLHHGDIIHDEPAVVVELIQTAVLAAEAPTQADLLRIVYALGN